MEQARQARPRTPRIASSAVNAITLCDETGCKPCTSITQSKQRDTTPRPNKAKTAAQQRGTISCIAINARKTGKQRSHTHARSVGCVSERRWRRHASQGKQVKHITADMSTNATEASHVEPRKPYTHATLHVDQNRSIHATRSNAVHIGAANESKHRQAAHIDNKQLGKQQQRKQVKHASHTHKRASSASNAMTYEMQRMIDTHSRAEHTKRQQRKRPSTA